MKEEERSYEGNNSCGRIRYAPVSDHQRNFKTADSGLRQADDLLSAVNAHAGRNQRHFGDFDAGVYSVV